MARHALRCCAITHFYAQISGKGNPYTFNTTITKVQVYGNFSEKFLMGRYTSKDNLRFVVVYAYGTICVWYYIHGTFY